MRLPLDIPSIDGYTTSKYGPRLIAGIPGDFHWGLDLGRKPKGSPVYAIDDGVVEIADTADKSSAGKYVRIGHEGGYQTRYLHLDTIMVKVGQNVLEGQMIGTLGSTGQSTGAHLHLDIIIEGQRVDPEPYLRESKLLPSVAPVVINGTVIGHGKLRDGHVWIAGVKIRDFAAALTWSANWDDPNRCVVLSPKDTDTRVKIEQAIDLLKAIL